MSTDRFYVYRPLLDLIGYTEGTDEGDGYNETLAFGAYTGGDVNLTRMTLDEIDELQTRMLKHPKNHFNSSAVGRYQIVRTTLRKIRKKLGLAGNLHFNSEMQDRMACFLLGGRGIDRFIAGKVSIDAMVNELAKEWASLPTMANKGHYGGQHARVNSSRVREVLVEVLARAQAKPKVVTTKVDDVLEDADKPLHKSTTAIGTAVTTAAGASAVCKEAADAATGIKGSVDMLLSVGPWILLLLVLIGFGGYLLYERRRKAKAAQKAKLQAAGLA